MGELSYKTPDTIRGETLQTVRAIRCTVFVAAEFWESGIESAATYELRYGYSLVHLMERQTGREQFDWFIRWKHKQQKLRTSYIGVLPTSRIQFY